jgi:hypothetical protein
MWQLVVVDIKVLTLSADIKKKKRTNEKSSGVYLERKP